MSLRPAKYSLDIWRGATFRHRFTYHTGADANTPPVDLTGWTAAFHVRPQSTLDALVLTTENGGVILGDTEGTIDILIEDEATADLNWQTATYELLLTDPAGEVIPLVWGSVRVKGI